MWSGITDWLSRKLKNTGNQSNHMSIFNPEREEMDLERFEDYQEK